MKERKNSAAAFEQAKQQKKDKVLAHKYRPPTPRTTPINCVGFLFVR